MKKTFVCGFPRTGTSLIMQMLKAAGLRVAGKHPFHEDARWVAGTKNVDLAALEDVDALKWLGSHHRPIPAELPDCRIIKTHRDPRQTAISHIKYLGKHVGAHHGNRQSRRATIKKFQDAFLEQREALDQSLAKISNEVLVVQFESLITCPKTEAARIAMFVGTGDPRAMSAVVKPRKVECLPEMLEYSL